MFIYRIMDGAMIMFAVSGVFTKVRISISLISHYLIIELQKISSIVALKENLSLMVLIAIIQFLTIDSLKEIFHFISDVQFGQVGNL